MDYQKRNKKMKDIQIFKIKNVRLSLAWYDIWIGLFIDSEKRILYICPLPFVLFTVKY